MGRLRGLLIIQGVLLVALIAGGAYFLDYTSQPSFCSSCHPVEPFAQTWEGSTHAKADVTCVECHFEPGAVGYVKGKIYSVMKLVQWAAGRTEIEPEATRTVVGGACRQCHEQESVSFIPHNFHVEQANLACTECHSAVVHGAELVGEDRPHAAADAAFCNNCHTGDIAPILFGEIEEAGREHPGVPKIDVNVWRNIHWRVAERPAVIDGFPYQQIERDTCLACHDEPTQSRVCRSCHAARVPEFRTSTAAQRASGLPLGILAVMGIFLVATVVLRPVNKARVFGSRWMQVVSVALAASDVFILYLIVRDTLIKETGSLEIGPTTVWITYLLVSAAIILLVLYEGVVKPGSLRLLLLPKTEEDEIYVPDPRKRTIGPKMPKPVEVDRAAPAQPEAETAAPPERGPVTEPDDRSPDEEEDS